MAVVVSLAVIVADTVDVPELDTVMVDDPERDTVAVDVGDSDTVPVSLNVTLAVLLTESEVEAETV